MINKIFCLTIYNGLCECHKKYLKRCRQCFWQFREYVCDICLYMRMSCMPYNWSISVIYVDRSRVILKPWLQLKPIWKVALCMMIHACWIFKTMKYIKMRIIIQVAKSDNNSITKENSVFLVSFAETSHFLFHRVENKLVTRKLLPFSHCYARTNVVLVRLPMGYGTDSNSCRWATLTCHVTRCTRTLNLPYRSLLSESALSLRPQPIVR